MTTGESTPCRKVLIVEDDEAMATALADGFAFEGFAVTRVSDGAAGLEQAASRSFDLVILDVMLPRLSGIEVCKRLRASQPRLPVIMLTARGQEIDKVLGLKAGADDYVTKPFSFLELTARVEAVLRRAHGPEASAGPWRSGTLEIDFARGEVRLGGNPVELSPRELRLLQFFLDHRGEILGRDRLLAEVWGYEEGLSRTVDVHVAKLRRKIEDDPDDPKRIVTIHGMGYKFTG